MHYISLQTDFMQEENIVLFFILQIMSEMCAQYLIYSVLIHNSSIEVCACIQNIYKKILDEQLLHNEHAVLYQLFSIYINSSESSPRKKVAEVY